jgi:site-specific recombinase XerD
MESTALVPIHPVLPAEHRELLQDLARDSRAASTWKAYQVDWRLWSEWAAQANACALPAEPAVVASYLAELSETRKVSTLKRYLASISVMHTVKGETFDRKSPVLRTIMKGIGRRHGGKRRKVRPLMVDEFLSMLGEMSGQRIADCRDAALLALGLAMAARRSELAGLDWMRRGTGTGVLELAGRGARIVLYTSKTKQGEPDEIYIQPGRALKAIRAWVQRAGIAEGSPLFRGVTRWEHINSTRLHASTIARTVKRRCEEMGLDAEHYSGHSLRAGMITTAFERGVPEWKIRLTCRHSEKSRELQGYNRPVQKRKHAVTTELGL